MTKRLNYLHLFRRAIGPLVCAALLAACTAVPRVSLEEPAVSAATVPVSAPVAVQAAAPAADRTAPPPAPVATVSKTAPQLGTQWGEARESQVRTVKARRFSEQPDDVAELGYAEARALRRELGNAAERRLNLLLADGDVEWAVLDEAGRPMPLQRARQSDGQFRVAGVEGARYSLQFRNRSDRTYEVVATVDGLDVLDGSAGSLRNGGYVLRGQESVTIEGFRKSLSEVATFRFSAPSRAYAANSVAGDVRNIGVLGAALFELEVPNTPRRPRGSDASRSPHAYPADSGFAPPPRYRK